MVVPVKTTDAQLRALILFFQKKVKAHQFKDLHINGPTDVSFGQRGYRAGMLLIYRGAKCAAESYAKVVRVAMISTKCTLSVGASGSRDV